LEFQGAVPRQETRVMGLLCGEGCVILTVTVFDWSTRVTDSGTDRQTDGRTGVSKERAIAYMLSRVKKRFTARCTVHSAVLRLHIVRLSLCPSVRLWHWCTDQDHIGWKSWKLTARTISPTPSLFVAQRPSTYTPRGTWGKFGGD